MKGSGYIEGGGLNTVCVCTSLFLAACRGIKGSAPDNFSSSLSSSLPFFTIHLSIVSFSEALSTSCKHVTAFF